MKQFMKFTNIFKYSYKNFGTLSNSNIIFMKKIDNVRNSCLKIKNCNYDLVFQTIWSNFIHSTILDKNKKNSDFPNNDLDYTNYSENSYLIFQKDESFFDYNFNNDQVWLKEINKDNIDLNIPNNNNNDLTIISRIPEEFSLNIESSKNILINNTGDSKLEGNVILKFMSEENKFNNFEARKIRSMIFSILCEKGNLNILLKSSLEVGKLEIVSLISLIKIKKLGISDSGLIKSDISEIDIRSIYNNSPSNFLVIENERGFINLGNCQGNLKIITKESKIVIDSLDCKECEIITENSEITVFFNSIEKNAIILSKKGKINLFINSDKSDMFNIFYEDKNVYLLKSNENISNIIRISSENEPKITLISSWEYIKEKLERKLKNKENKK